MDAFEKKRVSDQVADSLCTRIRAGEWLETLPSERWLSQDFGVARDEIHRAILKLRQMNVIEMERRKNRILGVAHVRDKRTSVVILTPHKLQGAGHSFLYCVDQLRARLGRKNIPVVVETSVVMARGSADKRLEKVLGRHRNAVWVLHRATPDVQKWFETRGLAAVVLGSASNQVSLPGVDIDHVAAVRHAMGLMKRADHDFTKIAFLRPDNQLEGVAHMENGYRDFMDSLSLTPCVVRFKEDDDGLKRKLTSLFQKKDTVEGVITTSYRAAVFLSGWLASEKGLVLGRDLSLVSLADGPILSELYPSVAYYSIQGESLSSRLVRRVNKLLDGERLGKRGSVFIIPEYVSGESVCRKN